MKDNYGTSRMLLIKRRPAAMFALIFLVENSFYYESATELSSDFKTGQHKMENSSSDPAKKKNCVG